MKEEIRVFFRLSFLLFFFYFINNNRKTLMSTTDNTLDSIQHSGTTYYIGDHIQLNDPTNTTQQTPPASLPSIAQIQQITPTSLLVLWYLYPQFTPHPPQIEFFPNTLLRSSRQSQVSLDQIQQKCYVVSPTQFQQGHPKEYQDGILYVCESLFHDKGEFVQKIKAGYWDRKFWPEEMDPERRAMLTQMVGWPEGPKEMTREVVSMETGTPHQTRRSTRILATPTNGQTKPPVSPAATPTTQQLAASYQQILAQTPTRQSQPPHQQMLQTPTIRKNIFPTPMAASITPAMISQFQKQQQKQKQKQQLLQPRTPITHHTNVQMPEMPTPPRRRGRPPKDKKLIERRAMEDAAYQEALRKYEEAQKQVAVAKVPPHQRLMTSPPPQSQPQSQPQPQPQPAQQQKFIRQLNPQIRPPPQMNGLLMEGGQKKPETKVPWVDPRGTPQLDREIVELFARENGTIRWFAGLPSGGSFERDDGGLKHSRGYLEWWQKHK